MIDQEKSFMHIMWGNVTLTLQDRFSHFELKETHIMTCDHPVLGRIVVTETPEKDKYGISIYECSVGNFWLKARVVGLNEMFAKLDYWHLIAGRLEK